MKEPRLIPCLLLADRRLVKTVRFGAPRYVGDPVNILNIFSTLGADEILLLDIQATREGRGPDVTFLSAVAEETMAPLGYGGGVRTVEDVRRVLAAGFEKVVVSTAAGEDPPFIERAAALAGSQAVVVSIDVGRDAADRPTVLVRNGTIPLGREPVDYAREMEGRGAGEILVHDVTRDGMMEGYDRALVRQVVDAVRLPVIALGGAGRRADLADVAVSGGASAAAAGSIFVFQGRNRSVVVNYPTHGGRQALFA